MCCRKYIKSRNTQRKDEITHNLTIWRKTISIFTVNTSFLIIKSYKQISVTCLYETTVMPGINYAQICSHYFTKWNNYNTTHVTVYVLLLYVEYISMLINIWLHGYIFDCIESHCMIHQMYFIIFN